LRGGKQIDHSTGHHFGGVEHIGDADVLVRLVCQIQNTGSVGNTIVQSADSVDVFLILGTG